MHTHPVMIPGSSSFLQWLDQYSRGKDLGLYVHIPFCQKRCHFCAFYLHIHREDKVRDFLMAIDQEISLYARDGGLSQCSLSTVYLGGGTPTSLSPHQLHGLFTTIKEAFRVHPQAEITVEATPDTVTKDHLQTFRALGVNRLSFGAQTFEEREWERLGRSGLVKETQHALDLVQSAGFDNINLDLIYGLPHQTVKSWNRTLAQSVDLNLPHLSCYALTIEEGTRFYVDLHRGSLDKGDPELENTMEDCTNSLLENAGYHHYEISNFCHSGFACRHNQRYWRGQDYLGLGPSSQSYIGGIRFGNVHDLFGYCHRLSAKSLPIASMETLTKDQIVRERIIFGLRLAEGVDRNVMDRMTDAQGYQKNLDRLYDLGFLLKDSTRLRLTALGRQYADTVAFQLL